MPLGKYFVAKSKLVDLSMGTKGSSDKDGAPVVLCLNNPLEPHQVWYFHTETGTIRLKANDFCLTVDKGQHLLNVRPYVPDGQTQQWSLSDDFLVNGQNGKVVDVRGGLTDPGTEICMWVLHRGNNQRWNLQHLEAPLFLLVSELNQKVLDVPGGIRDPGTKINLWNLSGESGTINQHWYEDTSGFIRSALNDFVLDGSTPEVTLQPSNPNNPNTCWVFQDGTVCLMNRRDHVLEVIVSGSKTKPGALVRVSTPNGRANQKWRQKFITL